MIGEEEAVPGLVGALLGDENSYVRWEAAKALRTLADERALPELLEALSADTNSFVRYAAAEALGAIGDPAALDALEGALLNDDNDYVRYAAATALGQIGDPTSVPVLLKALNHHNSHVWHAAAEAMWLMDEATMPYIVEGLIDPDAATRQAALKALLWLSSEFDEDEALERVEDDWIGMWGWWN
jgi:HEAT repeat protein